VPPEVVNEEYINIEGGAVVVHIEVSKPIDDIPGWTRVSDNTFEKEFTEVTSKVVEIITLQDFHGNDPVEHTVVVRGRSSS